MLRPPHSTQDRPQTMAGESILDMDPGELANTKTIEEMLQALGSTSITIQASDKKQLKPKTKEKKPPPILTISQSLTINADRVEEIKKKLLAFDVQKARLYDDLPNLTSDFIASVHSKEFLDLSYSDTKKSKRISKEDELIQKLALKNNKTIAEQKLITYRDFLTETEQLKESNQTLDKIEDLNNQEKIFSNHLNLLRPLSLQPKIANKEEGLKIEQKKFQTLIISQSKELSPLSIFLQTSSCDDEKKNFLDKIKAEDAESIFPIKESDPQQDSQSSGAPPLPPHVANWAKSCLAEKRGKKASWKMQAESIKNNSEIEALRASKAEAIKRHGRLEVEGFQIRQELEEIKKQNEALSDSIIPDNPNLEEVTVIARAEELAKVLEEKKEQESRTRIEAWKIQQELQIQEALLRVRKDGEILGLRPGQKPTIFPNQTEFKANADFTPQSTSGANELTQSLWMEKYLANLRGDEPAVIEALQKVAPDSLPSQGIYPPCQTLSGLQALGAGPFALALGNTQTSAQDLLFGKELLKPQAQTSLQYPPQHPQVAPPPFDQVASPRNIPAGTSEIFTRVSDANLVTNENPENHITQSVSDLDRLLENLSAEQLLGEFQGEFPKRSEDLTESNQFQEPKNQITESIYPQPTLNLTHDPLSDVPPPPSRDEVNKNTPQTIPRKQEEKKQFWQTFISTRLRERPSNFNQNSPRNNEDDLSQDELVTGSNPNSPTLESENSDGSSTFRSISSYSKEEDEIEERRIGLYTILDTILKTNLEKQNTTESNSSIDEEENTEEMDEENAKTTIETVMNYIATYTSDLASSISKDENKKIGETLQSEPFDTQTTQNSSTDDPIIYSGIGIRIKLENENGEYFLRITEVFENSGLHKTNDVNKKITQVECEGNLKSISAIHNECGGDEEKFYTKIALIFRDEKQEKLTLKIEGEEQERNVVKNIFIPEDKKGLNIYDNSQMTKIADKLIASRQNFSQLTTSRGGKEQTA